jgi:hypothetical protein
MSEDAGKHYRFSYKGINLDPFRIAAIYNMKSFAMMTILKKVLCAGNRGHKDYKQDLKDIICAAQRELEMLNEDFADSRITTQIYTDKKFTFTNVKFPDSVRNGEAEIVGTVNLKDEFTTYPFISPDDESL